MLPQSLRRWALTFNVNHSALTQLLHILHDHHPELPKDIRTLLKTPRSIVSKQLQNGLYCHLGLKSQLLNLITQDMYIAGELCIYLSFNVDGIPLFKSSTVEFWPILAEIMNVSNSSPFAVGIFCGKSKPAPLSEFLHDLIEELKTLLQFGLEVLGKCYTVKIHSFLCDAPARAYMYIKCIKSHGGYASCDKCTCYGQYA